MKGQHGEVFHIGRNGRAQSFYAQYHFNIKRSSYMVSIMKNNRIFSWKAKTILSLCACILFLLILETSPFCGDTKEALPDTFENAAVSCGKISHGAVMTIRGNQLVIDDASFHVSNNAKVYSDTNTHTSLSAIRPGMDLRFAVNPKGLICAIEIASQPGRLTGSDSDQGSNKGPSKNIKKIDGKWTNITPPNSKDD